MLVDLNDAEVDALVRVVNYAIVELSPEIVQADNWEHRTSLREQRSALQTALSKLRHDASTST